MIKIVIAKVAVKMAEIRGKSRSSSRAGSRSRSNSQIRNKKANSHKELVTKMRQASARPRPLPPLSDRARATVEMTVGEPVVDVMDISHGLHELQQRETTHKIADIGQYNTSVTKIS